MFKYVTAINNYHIGKLCCCHTTINYFLKKKLLLNFLSALITIRHDIKKLNIFRQCILIMGIPAIPAMIFILNVQHQWGECYLPEIDHLSLLSSIWEKEMHQYIYFPHITITQSFRGCLCAAMTHLSHWVFVFFCLFVFNKKQIKMSLAVFPPSLFFLFEPLLQQQFM